MVYKSSAVNELFESNPVDTTFTSESKAKLKFLNTDERSEERSAGVTSAAREKLIDSQTIFFAQKIPLLEDIQSMTHRVSIIYTHYISENDFTPNITAIQEISSITHI